MPAKASYDVTLRVDNDNLGTILSTVAGSAVLVSVVQSKVKEVREAPNPSEGAIKRKFEYVNGRRDKGISGDDLLMEILSSAKKAFGLDDIAQEFVNRGFARASASPVLHRAVKDGLVRALGGAQYCLPNQWVPMPKQEIR